MAVTSGTPEAGTDRIPERGDIAAEDKWNIEDLYRSAEVWEEDFKRIDGLVSTQEARRGTLGTPEAALAYQYDNAGEFFEYIARKHRHALEQAEEAQA